MKHFLALFLSASLFTVPAWALDRDSRPGAGSFEISMPSRYRVTHAVTLGVTGSGVVQTSATVPQPLRFPWSVGAGSVAYEAAQFSPAAPDQAGSAGPWHMWAGSSYVPYWLELQNGAAGEAWRWTLLNPAAGSRRFTASYEFTTADRRFRRELAPLTLGDLADPAKMPLELRGVKDAIRALTEPVPGQPARTRLPSELRLAVDDILVSGTHGGDLYKVLTRLSKWLTDRITYSADPVVLNSTREDLYANLVRGTGDCSTFSCTYTAMANAAGIPARVVMGMKCRPFVWPADPIQPKTYRDKVGWHVWVEVFLPGLGWTELEPQGARGALLNLTDGEPASDLFALSQYTQNQLTQAPLWEGASYSGSGNSVTFQVESDLTLLSGPRAEAVTVARTFPTATLSAPAHASVAVRGQPITLTANAAAATGAIIERVIFWVWVSGQGWQVMATSVAPPYSCVFTPTSGGDHYFTISAGDSFGLYSAYTSTKDTGTTNYNAIRPPGAPDFANTTVRVVAPGTPAEPVTCLLAAPMVGAQVTSGSAINLVANTTGAGIDRVEFYVQAPGQTTSSLAGTVTVGPPYQVSYTPPFAGTYYVVAEAHVGTVKYPALDIWSSFVAKPAWQAWKTQHFTSEEIGNAAVSGALADPAARGIRNLQAYAFGFAPRGGGWARLPQIGSEMVSGVRCVTLTYWRPFPRPPEVSYVIQAGSQMGVWTAINPDLPGNVLRSYVADGVEAIVVRDVPLDATAPSARWLRMQVTMP